MNKQFVRALYCLATMVIAASHAIGQSDVKKVTVTLMRWPYT